MSVGGRTAKAGSPWREHIDRRGRQKAERALDITTAKHEKLNRELERHKSRAAAIVRQFVTLFLLCVPAMLLAAPMPPADLAVLSDPTGRETVESVSAAASATRFIPLHGMLSAGYTHDVHWLRFTVQAQTERELWLEVQPPFLDDLRLYEPAENGFIERRTGDRLPFAVRELPYRAFVFKIAIPDDSPRTYYLRMQTTSTSAALVKLWRPDDFTAATHIEYTLIGLSFGIMGIVLLFNLILWIWLRDALHGWFCLYLLFYTVINIGLNGLTSEYLFPANPRIADAWLGTALFAGIAAATPFYRRILRIDARMPVLHVLFRMLIVAPLVLIPLSLFGYFTEAAKLGMGLILAMTFVALWRSWRMWREGCHEGLLLLLANSLPMLGSMMSALTALGLYPGGLLELNSRQFTGLGAIVAMHFALAIRIKTMRAELHEAGILKTIMDSVPVGVTLFDAELRMIVCNERFKRLLDFPDILFKDSLPSLHQLVTFNANRGDYGPGAPVAQVQHAMERATAMRTHVFQRTRPDGTVLEIRGTPLPAGRGLVTIYTDITERISNEQAIRRVKNLMSDAINFSSTYVWETDSEGRYTFLQGVEKILGYRDADLLGQLRWTCSWLDTESAVSLQGMMMAHATFDQSLIAANSRSDGLVWLSSSAQAVFDESGRFAGYRGVDVDVTELTKARQELEQMALHDALTGLANRRKFQLQYEMEVLRQQRTGNPLVLLIIDIDHFKRVNDSHGHIVGDVCLKTVAYTLVDNVRATDLVARFGGEEFIVLLPDTTLEASEAVAEKVRQAVEQTVIQAEGMAQALQVTISIGASVKDAATVLSLDLLIERADVGVYRAKDAGRNRVCPGD
jgi:diguanylate cyclase (GGDEF)-like protein